MLVAAKEDWVAEIFYSLGRSRGSCWQWNLAAGRSLQVWAGRLLFMLIHADVSKFRAELGPARRTVAPMA